MANKMIFHLPFEIQKDYASGSQIRPQRMMDAFRSIGYDVDVIMGYADDRHAQIQQIKSNIISGEKYDLVYSESFNLPHFLSEKNHIPKRPFLDFSFFKFCRKNGIPVALFYRDAHWNFKHYRKNFGWKNWLITYPFYVLDLRMYKKRVDRVYLPSSKMANFLPVSFKQPVASLPPGILHKDLLKVKPQDRTMKDGRVNLLYVGGLGNLYQLELLVQVVSESSNFRLKLCCREAEWNSVKEKYRPYLNDNIEIVHASGADLLPLFEWADMANIFVRPTVYWEFVMSLKLFEYMQHCKPMLAVSGSAMGEFVEENDLGWTINHDEESLKTLLNQIANNFNWLNIKQAEVFKISSEHTWEARAKKVVQDLVQS